MTTFFSAAELLALAPSDLWDLMGMNGGSQGPSLRAAELGLDVSIPSHLQAVQRACEYGINDGQPFSPAIGAAQAGVRSDRTPAEPVPPCGYCGEHHPGEDRHGDAESLGLPDPDPAAAAGMADMLQQSAGSGDPFMAGTFALYADPSGAVVMVTETATSGVRRDVIPRRAVKFALGLMAGKGTGMLGKLLGRG